MSYYPGRSAYYQNYRATSRRLVKPFILAAIHITGNSQIPSAMQEAVYSNRIGSGASFTFVTNRNGTVVQCLQPETQVPWTNGSWRGYNTRLPSVIKAVTQGYGANDATFLTIENVGYEWRWPINAAQIEACAKIIAWGSRRSGIPISRNTVLGHRDYDSYNRYYCPTGGNLETLLGKIITRAKQIYAGTSTTTTTTPSAGSGELPVNFKARPGWHATIIKGKPVRDFYNSTRASVFGNVMADTSFVIWGEVVGAPAGPTNNTRWMFGPLYLASKWRVVYIPIIDLKNRNF